MGHQEEDLLSAHSRAFEAGFRFKVSARGLEIFGERLLRLNCENLVDEELGKRAHVFLPRIEDYEHFALERLAVHRDDLDGQEMDALGVKEENLMIINLR